MQQGIKAVLQGICRKTGTDPGELDLDVEGDAEAVLTAAADRLGLDLIPTELTSKTPRAPVILVEGSEVLLLERVGEASFDELAESLGVAGAERLRGFVPALRRPLQSLANRSFWGRVASLIELERSDIWIVMIYAAAIGLATLATPVAVQALFDVVAFGTLMQPLVVVAALLFGVLAFSGILRVLEFVAVELIARRIFIRAASDFANRLPKVDLRKVSKDFLRAKSTRFLDAVVVEKSVTTLLFDGVGAVLQIGVGLLLLAFYHPILLAFDVVIIAGIAVVIFILGRAAIFTADQESKRKYEIADLLMETAQGTAQDGEVERAMNGWIAARRAQFRIQLRQMAGMVTLQVIAGVGLLLVGGALVIERQLSLGQLVAAEIVMTATVSSMAKVGKLLGKVYDLVAALGKLGSVIDLPMKASTP